MIAKMKCSNCGAEMSNLNLSWGKKYLWLMIPVMLIGFLPLLKLTLFKGDVTKDLSISDIRQRPAGNSVEVIGLITNSGNHTWSGVTIEAEFFDANGTFIDEAEEYVSSDVAKGAKEHFKMTIKNPSAAVSDPSTKMVLKVSGGHTMPF